MHSLELSALANNISCSAVSVGTFVGIKGGNVLTIKAVGGGADEGVEVSELINSEEIRQLDIDINPKIDTKIVLIVLKVFIGFTS